MSLDEGQLDEIDDFGYNRPARYVAADVGTWLGSVTWRLVCWTESI
jgi:hypothetical protein